MKNIRRYITEGWHVLAEIHTAIWLFGIFGISTSSIAQFLLSLPEKNYWPFLLLAQTVIWSLITVLAVGYVGTVLSALMPPQRKLLLQVT